MPISLYKLTVFADLTVDTCINGENGSKKGESCSKNIANIRVSREELK